MISSPDRSTPHVDTIRSQRPLDDLIIRSSSTTIYHLPPHIVQLLSVAEMEPQVLRDQVISHSVEARSAPWQRWARAWNELILSLRARDLVSNLERDEVRSLPACTIGGLEVVTRSRILWSERTREYGQV